MLFGFDEWSPEIKNLAINGQPLLKAQKRLLIKEELWLTE
jgi:hypothetical protein